MAKESKKDKQEKKELDIILEQLKKSYGSESPDEADTLAQESERDEELSSLLGKVFASDMSSEEQKQDDTVPIINETSVQEKEILDETTSEAEEFIESVENKAIEAEMDFTEEEAPKIDEIAINEPEADVEEAPIIEDDEVIEADSTEEEPLEIDEIVIDEPETGLETALSTDIGIVASTSDEEDASTWIAPDVETSSNTDEENEVDSVLDIMFGNPSKRQPHASLEGSHQLVIVQEPSNAEFDSFDSAIEETERSPIQSENEFFKKENETEEEQQDTLAALIESPVDDESDENDDSNLLVSEDTDYTKGIEEEPFDNALDDENEGHILVVEDEEYDISDYETSVTAEYCEDDPFLTENSDGTQNEAVDTASEAEYESEAIDFLPLHEEDIEASHQSAFEPEDKLQRPRLITSSEEYIVDPLQETLPRQLTKADTHTLKNVLTEQIIEEDTPQEELDINDISLLLKFGYDEEVKAKFGEESTQEALLEKDNYFVPDAHKIPFGYCGKELSDRSQIKEIQNKYKSDKRSIITRLVSISAIALLILAANVFFEFFSDRTSYPIMLAMEFLFIVLIVLILNKKLYAGVLGIIRFEAGLYSILAFILVTCGVYDLVGMILYTVNTEQINHSELMLFGFTAVLYTVLTLISDLINCTKEAATFDIIASSESLYTAEKQQNKTLSSVQSENLHGSSKSNYLKSTEHTYKILRTSITSGYFKKTSNSKSGNVNLVYLLGFVPIISLIVGCACALSGGSLLRGISAMMITAFLCTPFSFLCTYVISEYLLSVQLKKKRVAFIGSEAPIAYSGADTLIFKDMDTVEITSHTEIQPSKNANVKRYLSTAYQVFDALGGPLSAISKTERTHDNENGEEKHPNGVKHELIINEISDNGLNIYFNESTNILFGDKAYLREHGISVKTDASLTTATKGSERTVLYMAFDGSPKLGFIINSNVKTDFLEMVSSLEKDNVKVLVETYEPQINDLYFEQNKGQNTSIIKVYKPNEYEDSEQRHICDGSVVSASDALSVAEAIQFSREIVSQRKQITRLHLAVVSGGIVLACLLTVLLNLSDSIPFISALKSHITIIFNFLMIAGLIPGIIHLLKLNKNNWRLQ